MEGEGVELLFKMGVATEVGHAGVDGEFTALGFVAEWVAAVDGGEVSAAVWGVVLWPFGAEGKDDAVLSARGVVLDFEPGAAALPVEGVIFGEVHVVFMAAADPDYALGDGDAIYDADIDTLADLLVRLFCV